MARIIVGLDKDRTRSAAIPMDPVRSLLRNLSEAARGLRRHGLVSLELVAEGVHWSDGVISTQPGDATRFVPKARPKDEAATRLEPTLLRVTVDERHISLQWLAKAGVLRTAPLMLEDLQAVVA